VNKVPRIKTNDHPGPNGGEGHSDGSHKSSAPTHDEIRKLAYTIHVERGGQHGSDLDDWLQAERQLRDERNADREPGKLDI
jgi:hypothetical protein